MRPPFVITLALSSISACGGATDDDRSGVGGTGGESSGGSSTVGGSAGTSGSSATGGRGWGPIDEPGQGGTYGTGSGAGGFGALEDPGNTSGSSGSAGNPPAPSVPADPKLEPAVDETPTDSFDDPSAAVAFDPATAPGSVVCESSRSANPSEAQQLPVSTASQQACDCANDARDSECTSR